MEYLGTYHGAVLIRRGTGYFQQGDDGALGPKWREFRISKQMAQQIMATGRTDEDMFRGLNPDVGLPIADPPIWKTDPVDYLTWHRDHDPAPFSEHAAAALAALPSQGGEHPAR